MVVASDVASISQPYLRVLDLPLHGVTQATNTMLAATRAGLKLKHLALSEISNDFFDQGRSVLAGVGQVMPSLDSFFLILHTPSTNGMTVPHNLVKRVKKVMQRCELYKLLTKARSVTKLLVFANHTEWEESIIDCDWTIGSHVFENLARVSLAHMTVKPRDSAKLFPTSQGDSEMDQAGAYDLHFWQLARSLSRTTAQIASPANVSA